MTDDVKDLLGRAFGQEPPLRIDRDEVIQQGRKRLRRRRMFEASGVVAAVVVVAIGAATLTNLTDSEPERMPPAASRTQNAPPGPELPLPTPLPSTTKLPSSVSPPNGSSTGGSAPRGPSVLGVGELTQLLYDAGVVTQKDVRPVQGTSDGVPAFRAEDTKFVYQADVQRTRDSGSLEVTIDFTPGADADCAAVPAAFGDCEITGQGDVPVAVSQWRGADGERRIFAFTVMSNGIRIAAIASNVSSYDRKVDNLPADEPPVLDADQLSILVVKVGIRVG
jgi:hypothetical protein